MNVLYVFNHDCRLHDNALLQAVTQNMSSDDKLHCIYIYDERIHQQQRFGFRGLSQHRLQFLEASLADLENNLAQYQQVLHRYYGDSFSIIQHLHVEYDFEKIAIAFHAGVYEQQCRQQCLNNDLPLIDENSIFTFTLLDKQATDIALDNIQTSFTRFRKNVEPIIAAQGIHTTATPTALPQPLIIDAISKPIDFNTSQSDFTGGETAALKQLDYYCHEGLLDSYKDIRNGLLGWDFSSKLSAWLANGCLSVKTVWQAIEQFEENVTANDSTYWLKFELLWREYFHWLLYTHKEKMFAFAGIHGNEPNTAFNHDKFTRWCNGETGYAGVDAAMRQLKHTGWMSNRARQWVASCLVHELQCDWRYGAAYFEHQLIDFDVASNWGNWQYLAGVGMDPRGHRQFNLEKQLAIYDADGEFQRTYVS